MGIHNYSLSDPTEAPGFDTIDEVTSRDPYDEAMEFGIPSVCYRGDTPVIDTTSSPLNPGRRFYTCRSRDDGQCHICKWWDVALVEELRRVESVSRSCEEKFNIGIPKDIESKLNLVAVLEDLVKHSHTEMV
ncbi:unnamed protein product [Cochlearia groenlandica]